MFAVPADLVDKYLKIASGSSIKVLLYILRNSDKALDSSLVAAELSMNAEDVDDALVFWRQIGLLEKRADELIPALNGTDSAASDINSQPPELSHTADISSAEEQARLEVLKTQVLRTPQFSPVEIADTVKNDEKIKYIFSRCESLFGRPLKHTEQNALITIIEHIGLPAEVALMLVDYCYSIDKCSPAYLRNVAMDWVENGVTDFAAAEQYISVLQSKNTAESTIKSVFGLNRALSQKEKEFAALWINEWGFNSEIITIAYDINVNSKGKCSFPYISKILENWHDKGLMTKEQVLSERQSRQNTPKPSNSSLDIDEITQRILDDYK